MNNKDKSFFVKLILASIVFIAFLIVLGSMAYLAKNKLINVKTPATPNAKCSICMAEFIAQCKTCKELNWPYENALLLEDKVNACMRECFNINFPFTTACSGIKSKCEEIGTSELNEKKDETADWKTYSNEKYGYEVKYPVIGNFLELSSGIKGVDDKSYIVDFLIDKDLGIIITAEKNVRGDKTIEKLAENRNNIGVINVPKYAKEIQINGKQAFEWITYLGEPGSKRIGAITIAFNGGDYCYVIQTGNQYTPEFTTEKEKIYDLFLSTFKFIEKEATANWQTYKSDQYGFELKYPKGWVYEQNVFLSEPNLVFCPQELTEVKTERTVCKWKKGATKPQYEEGMIYLFNYINNSKSNNLDYRYLGVNNLGYYYLYSSESSNGLIVKQILSTFKFIN